MLTARRFPPALDRLDAHPAVALLPVALLPVALLPVAALLVLTGWFAAPGPARGDDQQRSVLVEPFPHIPPTPAHLAGQTFRTLAGFRLELLAAEPLVTDPVAIAYDENGLAYVVEMSDYPYTHKSLDRAYEEQQSAPIGRVRILEDSDGDGRFDKSTVFADQLSWPTGIACWRGGVYVTATPDIWYFKDTDGDRRADVRRKVFTGFRKFNVQAVINNLQWGLDHRIYGAGSSNGGQVRLGEQPDAPPIAMGANDFAIDPTTDRFELLSGGARFGNTFDDWGNRFLCNIRNPLQHVVLPRHYLLRNPLLAVSAAISDVAESGDTVPVYSISPPEPWRVARAKRWVVESGRAYPKSETVAKGFFTSTSGVTIYRGAAYPPEYHGTMFVGEVASNLIHHQVLRPAGVTFASRRSHESQEFVASTDIWFRPVNFVNAPDGTLHVLDMYRETIEHPWSIPDDIKAGLDLESGRDRGRIYRLAPGKYADGFQPPRQPALGSATIQQLVAELENPNSWWRETSQRLIYERQNQEAVAPLRALLTTSARPLARLHALWSLSGLGSLADADLLMALGDAVPGVREHAVRLSESRLANSPSLRQRVLALASDEAIRVRFQVAFSLGTLLADTTDREQLAEQAVQALAAIALRDGEDPWLRAAVLSSAANIAEPLLRALLADEAQRPPDTFVAALARTIGAGGDTGAIERTLERISLLRSTPREGVMTMVLVGLGEGRKQARGSLAQLAETTARGRELIARTIEEASRVALDAARPIEDRLRATQLLRFARFAQVETPLLALLEPRQPNSLQLRAVQALGEFDEPRIAERLLAVFPNLTPPARAEVVQTLLSRPKWIEPLLVAVEQGVLVPGQIPPNRRALLLNHAQASIKETANRLFGQDAPGPRAAVIAEYQQSLRLAGDARRGEPIFRRECLACHRWGDVGHAVGPNLNTIQRRTAEEVLIHVLDPNREVAPNFLEYVVTTEEGRVTTGIVAEETATSLTIRRAENQQETILRKDISSISSSGKSLMPEGLEKKVSPQEMADLLTFLLAPTPAAEAK